MSETIEWADTELLERLDNFMSDSPYEENLVMSARARLRQALGELARRDSDAARRAETEGLRSLRTSKHGPKASPDTHSHSEAPDNG